MFYYPRVAAATPVQHARVLIIADPPPVPPAHWPRPHAQRAARREADAHCLRLTAEEVAKLREDRFTHEYLPDPMQPCLPKPSDRELVSALFGWVRPTHDLLLRGGCSSQGVREGRWEVCTLDERVVAIVRYWAGVAVGNADLFDAGGFTVERVFLYDGVFMARGPLLNPIIEPTPSGSGPVPLGVPCRHLAGDGSRWEGLERDGCRVGPWLGYHANGKLSAVQHYHLDSGAAIGPWEYYDEHGDRTDVRPVLE